MLSSWIMLTKHEKRKILFGVVFLHSVFSLGLYMLASLIIRDIISMKVFSANDTFE